MQLTIEQARAIHSDVMGVLFAREGLRNFDDQEIERLKAQPLAALLQANELVINAQKDFVPGVSRSFVTNDETIALLYLRLRQPDFLTLSDLQDAIEAADDAMQSHHGHGILLDRWYMTLIELDSDGAGGETVFYTDGWSKFREQLEARIESANDETE